jgi:predicted dehydrogenase
LGALGSHAIDGFRWLLGVEVLQVFANLLTHVKERPDAEGQKRFVSSDDECNMLLRFADGPLAVSATGAVSLSMVEAGAPEHRLEIFGEKGALMVEGNGELWRSEVGKKAWRHVRFDLGELAPGVAASGWGRGFTAFSKLIVAALQEGQTRVDGAATFDDGYHTQLVMDAARASHEQGSWAKPGK